MPDDGKRPSDEELKLYVAIWSKAIDTQMHFNEMSVKARQFGLAFVAAALALGVALLSRGSEYSLLIPICAGFRLHVTVLVLVASAGALLAVRILDLGVYHRMLRGAVAFGEDFEEQYLKKMMSLEKGMTQAVSHFSRHGDGSVTASTNGYRYSGSKQQSARDRLAKFYTASIAAILAAALALFLATADFGLKDAANDPPDRPAAIG